MLLPLPLWVGVAAALNVVVTLVDLWVTKDVRFLHSSLWFHGHDLTLVALLYQRQLTPQLAIDDGGDFDHLLPVHQKFFANVKKINQAHYGGSTHPPGPPRPFGRHPARAAGGPRGFVAVEAPEITDYDVTMGRDPLDQNAWYVNHDPVRAIRLGLDMLEAETIDVVVILVPEDDTVKQVVAKMVEEVRAKGISLLVVNIPGNRHIYYQDENYFRVQQPNGRNLRRNEMCRNIRIANHQVRAFLTQRSFTEPQSYTLTVDTLIEDLRPQWRHPLRYRHSRPLENQQPLGWNR